MDALALARQHGQNPPRMPRKSLDITSRLAPFALARGHALGLDVKALLERHELPADLDWKSAGKIELTLPAAKLKALVEDVAEQLKAPHLGLDIAKELQTGTYGVAEFLIRSSATVRGACENTVRFNALMAPDQQFSFETHGAEASLQHGVAGVPDALSRHHHEYTMYLLASRFLLMLDGARIERLWFANSRPKDVTRLVEAFGTQAIEFDRPMNGFAFDASRLDEPAKTGDAALFAFLEEHAVAALASRPKTDDLIDRLRHSIREALKQGEPNIERIATRLALSGRTLQRRLSELDTSFQSVLDDVRFDLARAYLRDVRIDITQVAYLLGYSELRAFDRAFKRWAKVTPREWRDESARLTA